MRRHHRRATVRADGTQVRATTVGDGPAAEPAATLAFDAAQAAAADSAYDPAPTTASLVADDAPLTVTGTDPRVKVVTDGFRAEGMRVVGNEAGGWARIGPEQDPEAFVSVLDDGRVWVRHGDGRSMAYDDVADASTAIRSLRAGRAAGEFLEGLPSPAPQGGVADVSCGCCRQPLSTTAPERLAENQIHKHGELHSIELAHAGCAAVDDHVTWDLPPGVVRPATDAHAAAWWASLDEDEQFAYAADFDSVDDAAWTVTGRLASWPEERVAPAAEVPVLATRPR